MDYTHQLLEEIKSLRSEVNQLRRQINNIVREAHAVEVFPDRGTMKVLAQDMGTHEIPWVQRAGDIVEWNPPSVGERVTILSPSGDTNRAVGFLGGYTNLVPQPHDKSAETFRKIGSSSEKHTGSQHVWTAGGVTVTIDGTGLHVNGGAVTHDGKVIDKTHKHTDTTPGAGLSGPPE